MTIEKYFPENDQGCIVFDPIPSYEGEWSFSIANLKRNAKKVDGKNLWDEFFAKTYLQPLQSYFKNELFTYFKVRITSLPNQNGIGRVIRYNKKVFFKDLLKYFLCDELDMYGYSKEDYAKYLENILNRVNENYESFNLLVSNAFKTKRIRLEKLEQQEFKSEYFDAAMLDYAPYKKEMDFTSYIKMMKKIMNEFELGLLYLGDFFERPINFKELYSLFDSDKFYLLFAKIISEQNKYTEKLDNHLDNTYGYLIHYKNNLENLLQNDKDYNPVIEFQMPNEKQFKKISKYEILNDINGLLQRHPEAKLIKLPDINSTNIDSYRNISLIKKLEEIYQSEEIKVNWEVLPIGEGIKRLVKKNNPNNAQNKKDLEENVNLRIEILENSGFIGMPIKGLNTFNGYYAFVYASGIVILEKFFTKDDALIPASHAATYVMNIDNFVDMSKIPRIDLVKAMQTKDISVKRIFHTSINNWQKNLYKAINGTYRLEDAVKFIRNLKVGDLKHDK